MPNRRLEALLTHGMHPLGDAHLLVPGSILDKTNPIRPHIVLIPEGKATSQLPWISTIEAPNHSPART